MALYVEGGIRGCEIGTVMFGRHPDGTETPAADGPGPPRDPAPDVHPEPHRLRDRGRPGGGGARRGAARATGSCPSRRPCATSRPASRRSRDRDDAGAADRAARAARPAADPRRRCGAAGATRRCASGPTGSGGRRARPRGRPPSTSTIAGTELAVRAWGDGAAWALEQAPAMAGVLDEPAALAPLVAGQPLLRELARRNPGLRFGRTLAVMESLVPAIIEQKVTGNEAHRAWRGLVRCPRRARAGARVRRSRPGCASRPSRPCSPACPTTRSTASGSSAGGPRRSGRWRPGRPGSRRPHGPRARRSARRGSARSRASGRGRPPKSPPGRGATRTR